MTTRVTILSALLICCNGLSIGTVSDQNVNQSEPNIGDSFPDWVPFKNKHGDELGEFVQVTKKKIKKRLASPVNFILRAVAEPEGDDYFDKGQGGGDSEDNYENKDWSDLHRSAEAIDKNMQLNHTALSDIDGVVDILTRKPKNDIADAINNARKINAEHTTDEPEEEEIEEGTTEIPTTKETPEDLKKVKNSEEEIDYDEGSAEKQKSDPAEDVSESEAKKAKILDEVDELKERHAAESKAISEKIEEEMYQEEFERNKHHPVEIRDKYSNRKPYKRITPDYDEYEDKNASIEDKYKVRPIRIESTSQQSRRTTPRKNMNKHIETGKLSVFKNPQLYMVYDDSDETTTVQPKRGNQKFSARYTSTPPTDNEDERISLIPEDSKEGEPTLFFPKKRKSRRRKIKTTTPATANNSRYPTAIDTSAAETILGTKINTGSASGNDVTTSGSDVTASGSDVTASATDVTSGSDVTAPGDDVTGPDTEPLAEVTTAVDDVTDAEPASSDHKKEEKNEDYRKENGGGREHHSEHDEEHEEHGKKAYEGHHEDTKKAKGHHDKDNHLGKYEDHGGVDKHHKEESGHYGKHHHEEHGKKHAKYEESGKHAKGHSTKGSHDVHKKEEYEKKVEFFEEDGDSAEEEKHGGYNSEKEHSEGGKFKKDDLKAGHHHHSKGESGHFGKAGHSNANKGHKQAAGHDSHGKHGGRHFHKGSKDSGQKWVYHHGYPPRTANLVVIDRRGDQLFHGPQYYG